MNIKHQYILNPLFLTGLLLLLLNDHILKQAYGNWWTGKLSDFAGLLILPLFLKYLLPVSDRRAVVLTVLIFIYWKSPFSQPLIDGFNSLGLFPVTRVVDYSDFLAFLILPVAFYVLRHTGRLRLPVRADRRWAARFVLLLTLFVFAATSYDDEQLWVDDPTIASCCGLGPVEEGIGTGRVFIPNIFTPDGNGRNDFFQVSADANILRIDTFIVYELNNFDTVFYATNIEEIIPENGFNGRVAGIVPAAQYAYKICITSVDSISRAFTGNVCSVPCVAPLELPRPAELLNCGFSAQHNFGSGYNPLADPGEELDCFE